MGTVAPNFQLENTMIKAVATYKNPVNGKTAVIHEVGNRFIVQTYTKINRKTSGVHGSAYAELSQAIAVAVRFTQA